jgi:hypothetical protein
VKRRASTRKPAHGAGWRWSRVAVCAVPRPDRGSVGARAGGASMVRCGGSRDRTRMLVCHTEEALRKPLDLDERACCSHLLQQIAGGSDLLQGKEAVPQLEDHFNLVFWCGGGGRGGIDLRATDDGKTEAIGDGAHIQYCAVHLRAETLPCAEVI